MITVHFMFSARSLANPARHSKQRPLVDFYGLALVLSAITVGQFIEPDGAVEYSARLNAALETRCNSSNIPVLQSRGASTWQLARPSHKSLSAPHRST